MSLGATEPSPSPSAASGSGRWAWAIFWVVLGVHATSEAVSSGDSRWFIPVAVSLLSEGNIDLDEYEAQIRVERDYAIDRVNGHAYNLFPVGTALLVAPFVWLIEQIEFQSTGASFYALVRERPPQEAEQLIASIIVAMTAALLFLIASDRLPGPAWASIATAVFAFATPAWSTASRALWQHGPSMLLLTAALYGLVKAEAGSRVPVWIGPALAYSWIIRPTNALSIVALLGVVWIRDRPRFWINSALALGVLGLFVAFNLSIYGQPLPRYFRAGRLLFGPTFAEALAGNLVSPSRGLWVFSPIFLLAAVGLLSKFRRRSLTDVDFALLLLLGAHWVAISMFPQWWGGYSVGPRFFCDVVPYLVYLLLPTIELLADRRARGRGWLVAAFVVLAAWSVFTHGRSATRKQVPNWNSQPVSVDERPERVWDWHDPQFLR